ncbi:ESX secretion-associated protein EspG [Nocardia mexicana]|uniref:ESAT-6 protein secretion system EspG family protein n=1 Tax=Nocardia mexicana TaxID=279262 RepID=A0A370GXM1_9NOCA|nr:ESX secretion-associated protein EspG [Nocardia mexicana]RDI48402.1 ESAT-6 protein secretion system EspG family protein [Nocardia mexicana]
MTVLGAGNGPSMLEAVTLSFHEFQLLQERLELTDIPVVLSANRYYENNVTYSEAMSAAAESLTDRDLLHGDAVAPELADRMRVLDRPHWALEMRWIVGDAVNRLCVAKGDDMEVVALRGPDSFVIDQCGPDLPGTVIAALGSPPALELYGMNAPTEELAPILGDTGDSAATARRLAQVGKPDQDATTLAAALVEIQSAAEIVGVIYGDGERDFSPNHVAVFDTRNGRFLSTTSVSDDDVKWSSLSSGTPARLRAALENLIESLPLREDFKPNPGVLGG